MIIYFIASPVINRETLLSGILSTKAECGGAEQSDSSEEEVVSDLLGPFRANGRFDNAIAKQALELKEEECGKQKMWTMRFNKERCKTAAFLS